MNLKDHFPRCSKSFLDANPTQGGLVYLKPNQNATTVNLTPKKAKHEANHQCKIQDSEPQSKDRRGKNQFPAWSESEIQILRWTYLSGNARLLDSLPRFLKRTPAAISCKAGALGISFKRGKHPRVQKPIKPKKLPRFTNQERSKFRSDMMKERHMSVPHPMLGKPVPNSVRLKISLANKGRIVPRERVDRSMKTRASNGTMVPNHAHGSWKSGWREIGERRIYARSRWEANYARYLELLKRLGEISDWQHEPETFWFDGIKRGCRSYLPDFKVTFPNGRHEWHECKGWMDKRSATKIKRMKKYHPGETLIVRTAEWFRSNRVKLRGLISDWEDGKL